MKLYLVLLVLFAAGTQAAYSEESINVTSINGLSPRYNNYSWYPLLPSFVQYLLDAVRYVVLIFHFYFMTNTNIFMFQEMSINAPCLTNSSVMINGGNWEPISSAMDTLGYDCYIGFHDERHWWKYYDYERCDQYNSYTPTGNGICVKRGTFSSVQYEYHQLVNGSALPAVKVTWNGRNYTFASVHFDSDVVGIRNAELRAATQDIYPADLNNIVVMCGDQNTASDFGAYKHILQVSGYTDPHLDFLLATGQEEYIVPSQPLATGWYHQNDNGQHRKNIDFCIVVQGGAIVNPKLFEGDGSLMGYPNSTISGVLDFGLWKKYPIQNPPRQDPNALLRNGEAMQIWGSDHFGYRVALKMRL